MKHVISLLLFVLLSIAFVMFTPHAQQIVQMLVDAHDWVATILTDIFTGNPTASIARELIALVSMPLVIGLVPAIIYAVVRRHWLPCFMQILWVVWLLQAGALAIAFKAGTLAVTGN